MRINIVLTFILGAPFCNAFSTINFSFTSSNILHSKADYLVFFVEDDFSFSSGLKKVAKKFFPSLKELMKKKEFTGGANSRLLVPVNTDSGITNLLFLGLGPAEKNKILDIENLRRALGHLIRTIEQEDCSSVAIKLPTAKKFGVTHKYLGKQVASTLLMAQYHFNQFITDETEKKEKDLEITLVMDDQHKAAAQEGVHVGVSLGTAVNSARLWVDMPPSNLTPADMEQHARKIAETHGIDIKVLDETTIKKLGMGGISAVSAGSEREACLVILEYKTKKPNAPTLAFVGKGITFDSGGLNIKQAQWMKIMKFDMAGAATVIAAMDAIAQLKPDVNVLCIAPLSENLPSGTAFMPGDIVRFYNGKTAEINNTDAEGRLILADALAYTVEHYQPDAIVDLATLTGAVIYALGPFFTGILTKDDALAKKMNVAAKISGDRIWRLPLHDDYKPSIKSSVADIANTGSETYEAGATAAALFLKNFVDDTPWVHLDIAGTAFNVPDISYYRDGATGSCVRLLVELAMNWNKC